MSNVVTITLQNNDEGRYIIEAIEQDNADAVKTVYPSMVKFDAPERIVVNKATVEDLIGRDWDVQELHLSIVSIGGQVDEEDEYFALEWRK